MKFVSFLALCQSYIGVLLVDATPTGPEDFNSRIKLIKENPSNEGKPQFQTKSQNISVPDALHYVTHALFASSPENILARDLDNPRNVYDVDKYNVKYNSDKTTRALILLDHKRNEIILGFRGTANLDNWVSNLKIGQVDFIAGKVHKGFKKMADDLKESYKGLLTSYIKKYPKYTLVVTGHSLGGALAVLSTAILQKELNIEWEKIILITYGQPRVGNQAFASWLNSKPMHVTRVVNQNDIYPHLPPKTKNGYVHANTEIYLNDKIAHVCQSTGFEAKTCSNSRAPKLSTKPHDLYLYRASLKKVIYGGEF
ncbi:hypothetical protein DSO57_1002685 [Entomophthora muscae]|uniref:Uncharacterized protein n=1 Tax=Entomophthora muscae TaxID=34485 RepID=A0ACC2UHP4_9FUNG|nr:hypothetical protein DSO57_1002685 [Entomophthora muscae]